MRVSIVSPTCYIDFDEAKLIAQGEAEGEKKEVEITSQLYKILEFFAEHPGEYISKKTLLRECWGIEIDENLTHCEHDGNFYSQIRKCRSLHPELELAIETKHGMGYRYNGKRITGGQLPSDNLDMTDVRGFCIGDLDHSGCQVRRDESGPKTTTAVIDFSLTDSKLCSVVYFTGLQDWSQLAADHKLCFEARAVPGPVQVEVELRLKGRDSSVPVLIREELGSFEVPLQQFAFSPQAWEELQEIHLLFRRRTVAARTAVTVKNLRVEG